MKKTKNKPQPRLTSERQYLVSKAGFHQVQRAGTQFYRLRE